jgi:hypothetical protein
VTKAMMAHQGEISGLSDGRDLYLDAEEPNVGTE